MFAFAEGQDVDVAAGPDGLGAVGFQVPGVPRVLADLDHLRGAGAHVELELAADQVVNRDGEELGGGGVGEQHLAGGIGHDDAVGLVHDDVGEARFLGSERTDAFLGRGGAALTLDGVADGAAQALFLELALDQVVLGALADRGGCHHFVAEARKDDDWNVASAFLRGCEGLKALGLAETEVQQNDGGIEVADRRKSVRQIAEALNFVLHVAGWDEHFFQQPNVAGVVLDDQDAERLCGHCSPPSGRRIVAASIVHFRSVPKL